MNEVIKTILKRKSVRSFSDKEVSEEIKEIILKAAMAAPSAMNRQIWEFYVIDDKELLKELSEKLPYSKMLARAPFAIMICGDTREKYDSDFWIQDCSASTENILLTVESLGLGAVWNGIYPRIERVKILQKVFDLPKHLLPLNIIPIGYPDREYSPIDKWDDEKIHIVKSKKDIK